MKVIPDITIEGWNSYKCRVCSFTSPLHVRLRAHISNRHFNGPVCICKICGLQSKNMNSLCQHVSRSHRSRRTKKRAGGRSHTIRPLPSHQATLTVCLLTLANNPARLDIGRQAPNNGEWNWAPDSLHGTADPRLIQNRVTGYRKQPLHQVRSCITKAARFK